MGGFSRRVRIMTGNFEQLREMKALMRPLRAGPLFFFLSHKAGRLVVPLAMLAMLVANLFLLDRAVLSRVVRAPARVLRARAARRARARCARRSCGCPITSA